MALYSILSLTTFKMAAVSSTPLCVIHLLNKLHIRECLVIDPVLALKTQNLDGF